MRFRYLLAAGALACAGHALAQVDFAKGTAMIQEIIRLQGQGRWEEAEDLARKHDAQFGSGQHIMTESVARMRKLAAERPADDDANAPKPLFIDPDTLWDDGLQFAKPAELKEGDALNERGIASFKAGDLAGAIRSYEAAEAALRGNLAKAPYLRSSIASVASNLGIAYWRQGDARKAGEAFQRALQERAIATATLEAYPSESAALAAARAEALQIHPIMSLERELGGTASPMGLQFLLEHKGIVLERQAGSIAAFRRQAHAGGGLEFLMPRMAELNGAQREADRKLLAEYEQVSRERAELAIRPAASGEEEADRQRKLAQLDQRLRGMQQTMRIDQTTKQQVTVGGALSTIVSGLFGGMDGIRASQARAQTARQEEAQTRLGTMLQDVRERLAPDAVLLEMVKYRDFDPRRSGEARWGQEHYGTYVVSRDAEPVYVELGEASRIDRLVQEFRRALSRQGGDAKGPARRLDEAVMQPVRARMGSARSVYLAPEGALNLIPFAALVDERGQFLLERYTFNHVASGRDLLQPNGSEKPRTPPVIVADPLFAVAGGNKVAGGSRSVDFSRTTFSALPGTAREARALAPLLPGAVSLTGAQATETAVKHVAGPSILHIATHGFFLQDVPASGPESARGLGRVDPAASPAPVATPRAAENPMLRSGLVFAGVNGLRSGEDDGVLTALEAAALDLRGTQLVVLSACETGVGEVRNGEGVFGLRRAFAIAGAETLVMSLWQVADDPTMELMTGYYGALKSGASRAEALRQAQLALLKRPATAAPYYWAAFISSGNAGPLQ